MLAALVLPVLAASSASASLYSRTVDDIWGGVNISKAALDVYSVISSPTCNATQYCVEFATKAVPRCTALQGTAGCWCTLHDPLHYCALCMSNPTDNTTTPAQTQLATTAHADYHKGCGAWIAFINATATSVSSSSAPSSSSSASASSTALASTSSEKSMSTGAVVGAAIGGIGGLILLLAILFFVYRHMQNKAAAEHAARHAPPMSPKMSEFYGDSRFSAAPSGTFIAAQHTARSDVSRAKSSDTLHRTPPPPFQPNRPMNTDYDTSMLGGYPKQPEVMQ